MRLFRKIVVGIERFVPIHEIDGAVGVVGAGLGYDVDGRTFTAAVYRREPLRADIELEDGFKRELHNRAANRVVFVVNAVDRHVDVSSGGTVGGKHSDALLGGIVRIRGFRSRREVCQVGKITAVQRKVFDLFRSNGTADVAARSINNSTGLRLHCHHLRLGAWL